MKKERLDKLLVELGLAETRTKAQALIMAGHVRVNGQAVTKAGALFAHDIPVTVDEVSRWAGRGAFKLLRAFDVFGLEAAGRVCADFGASTGGFTDVLLDRGAARVYAVDVGYGQLVWRLASDERVIVMDRTNARFLRHNDFPETIELGVCDVSFISLRLILPALDDIARDEAVILIKPQFEAGRDKVTKGIVRDEQTHSEVLEGMIEFIEDNTSFNVSGLTHSPVKGSEGNIEFLCHITHRTSTFKPDINAIVKNAHEKLQR